MRMHCFPKKRILVIEGYEPSVLNSRLALLKSMVHAGHEAHVIAPEGDKTRIILKENCIHFHSIDNNRHSISLKNNIIYFLNLYHKIKEIQPDICLTYTIKPGIYGIIASACANVKNRYAVITGLGYSFIATGIKATIVKGVVSFLYALSFKFCKKVIFQNEDDQNYFCQSKLVKTEKTIVVHGSGIDLNYFTPQPLQKCLCFLMISRFLPEKGIFEYIEACKKIKAEYPNVRCCLVGYIDNPNTGITEETLTAWQSYGIEYLGQQDDVRPALTEASVYVLPSYREGTPRSVLEAMAMGRAIITTDAPGCRQTVENKKNGYLIPIKDSGALYQAMLKFIHRPDITEPMGNSSLKIVSQKFSLSLVNKSMLTIMQLSI